MAQAPPLCYASGMMSKPLAQAIEKARALPRADQDRIGRDLGRPVDDLRALRAKLDEGAAELDAGLGREIDVEDVIARARAQHVKG